MLPPGTYFATPTQDAKVAMRRRSRHYIRYVATLKTLQTICGDAQDTIYATQGRLRRYMHHAGRIIRYRRYARTLKALHIPCGEAQDAIHNA